MQVNTPHTFHIPVMGLAYTIDSPIKVACYGITSTISIIQDNLLESMRKHYYQEDEGTYFQITTSEHDYRAKRITDYLNLVNRIVHKKTEDLRNSGFSDGSELIKYYEMLPDGSDLKKAYKKMLSTDDTLEKLALQQSLREAVRAGSIEVNIMTKLDRNQHNKDHSVVENGSDALTALRGYATSELTHSSIVFSAGMNPRLFNYMEGLPAFDAVEWGHFHKKVIIKVSDYRSALIQGKYLAKKGIWVSEFRVESGLNCGGHAFATDGHLLGPIMEEFKAKKHELISELHSIYTRSLQAKEKKTYERPHPIQLSVQGGIGTHEEDQFLHEHYGVNSTGWGTPFLLCPEATTLDKTTRSLLSSAKESDVILSKNSPLGVRFNYLSGASAEKEKLRRINNGTPGSPCTEKYLVSNTEFTDNPICTASRKYQKLKLAQLKTAGLSKKEYQQQAQEVTCKECLCIGLSNAAPKLYQQTLVKGLESINICPGPNIAYFSKVVSLKEMIHHIYGRSILLTESDRPHMFIKELNLYVEYLKEYVLEHDPTDTKTARYIRNFGENLLHGIHYYHQLIHQQKLIISSAFEKAMHCAQTKIEYVLNKSLQ